MGHLCAHYPGTAGGSAADQRKWYPVFNTSECAVCEAVQNLCMESVDDVGDEIVDSMHFAGVRKKWCSLMSGRLSLMIFVPGSWRYKMPLLLHK